MAAVNPELESPGPAWICNRCGKENPRIAEAPFDSDIGKKIQASICVPCWREWMAMSIKVINEYRLNLATERGQQVYDQAMAEFLGLGGGGSGGEPAPR